MNAIRKAAVILAASASASVAQADLITLTGAELLESSDVSFYRSTPALSGDSIVFDSQRSDRWEKLFSLQVLSEGHISADSPTQEISVSLNMTRLTNDWDPYILLSDGNYLTGPVVSDNFFTVNDRPGTAWLYDFEDAGDTATQLPIQPKVIIADAGFPNIGQSFDVHIGFLLGKDFTSIEVAFLEGTGQPFRTSSIVLDRTTDLSLVMLGENISEKYQINTLTIDVPTSVPEPSTLALLGLGLVGMAARRKRTSA